MINIYAFYFKNPANNNTIYTGRKLIQSVPAGSESAIRILPPAVKGDFGNAESMDFSIQNGTEYYDAFIQMRTYILVEYDGDVIFYGRVLTINDGFFGERKIRCEGSLAFLNDSYYQGIDKKNRKKITIKKHIQDILDNHNSQVGDSRKKIYMGEVPGNYTSVTSSAQRISNESREFGSSSWATSKSLLEDLKSHYGGAFRIRYVLDTYTDTIGQYGKGNIDLNNRIVVHNSDGSISTEVSITITSGGKYVLIPTVIDGQIVSDQQAINYYNQHNKYLGKFNTLAEADDYAIKLHERQDWYYNIRPNANKCYLDWVNHYYRSTVNSQKIEVGKNLIDISGSTEVSNIFTVLIPIGKTSSGDNAIYLDGYTKDNHTFSGNLLTVPEICKSLYSYGEYSDSQLNSGYHQASDYKNAIESYGRILKTMEFQEAHNQETLYEKAVEWIKNNYQGGVDTFSVKAVDLHFIGESSSKILLGDRVRIKYPVGTTTTNSRIVERTLTCTSVTYDLYNPENNQYTFGIPANMLGKTYGDNSQKQTKRSTSYKPPENPDPDIPEESWDSQVIKWLETHKIWKKSVPGSGSRGAGPTVVYSDGTKTFGYFLETILTMTSDGRVQRRLWAPIIQGIHTKPDKPTQYEYVWQRDANNRPQGTNVIKPSEEITPTVIDSRKLFDYIKDEWGIDLKNGGLSVNKPSVYTTDDGNVEITVPGVTDITIGTIINPETGEVDTEGIKAIFSSALPGQDIEIKTDKYGNTGYYKVTPDGRTVMVTIDPVNGDFQYIDPATGQPTNIRSLHLETVSNSNFIGSMVTQDYADADGTIHIYKFGQGIERWAGGEMVVAYVDGDIVKIGSRDRTKKIYITGEQIILGDADSETTIIDTLKQAGVIKNNLKPNALITSAVYTEEIGALRGRIGTLETDYLKTSKLNAEIGKISSRIYVGVAGEEQTGLAVRGTLDISTANVLLGNGRIYVADGTQISAPGTSNYHVKNMIVGASVSNNILTLTPLSGDPINFSRAVSYFEGTWSGNHYYVTVSPQNQTGGDTYLFTSQDGWGNDYKQQLHVYYIDTEHDNAHVDVLSPVANASVFKLKVADVKTIANDVTAGIQVRSANNKGLYSDYKTLSMALGTYSPSGVGGTKRCVVVKDGTAIVGRYDVSSVWTECYNTVEAYASTTTISPGGSVKVYAQAKASYDASSKTNKDYVTITASGYTHNASLYCSSISDADPSGHRTVTLTIQYSTSQTIPFSVGSRKTVYFN